jgi:two-component system heavy metal sensor histidine kinase CusS
MSSISALRRADPRRWPLTVRLTLFISCAMAAILFAVSGLLYQKLKDELREQDEAELGRAVAVETDVVKNLVKNKGRTLWQEEWREDTDRAGRIGLRVLAPDGSVHGDSSALAAPAASFPPAALPATFVRWRTAQGDKRVRRLLTAAAVEPAPGQRWVVQGELDLAHSHAILDGYWTWLSMLLCCAVGAAAAIGFWIARRALAPVRAIRAEIGRVSVEKLHARIGEHPWPADLQVLAQSFDAMLERLEASFEQLSRFSSDLAHEFRSPINNLVAAASVTLSRERSGADYRDTLAVVADEGERLSRMVSSMLFLARADNAQQAMQCADLQARDEFDKLLEFFDALAEEKQLAMSCAGDAALSADPILLRRALSNLIANAIQHTAPGGSIALEARALGAQVELSVRDSGSGIAACHLPHLFDRFYRVDTARSSSESTGLGLALVKSIAELHGGSVSVASVPGEGARFAIVLPA